MLSVTDAIGRVGAKTDDDSDFFCSSRQIAAGRAAGFMGSTESSTCSISSSRARVDSPSGKTGPPACQYNHTCHS